MSKPEKKKRHFWEVDTTIFERKPKGSFFDRRIFPSLRFLGKYTLFVLVLTYPIYLVLVGVVYGGIVFWAFLGGSFALAGFLISRLGYARHFATWGEFSFRRLGAFFLAFPIAVGFYLGLIYLRAWFVPIALAAFALAIALGMLVRRK